MSFPFTFGQNNNMATTDVDDSCLFENSMHAGHHHQNNLDLPTFGQEGGTNIDMPPPPPVYPNKKRCIGNNKNGESSTNTSTSTMNSNDENQRAEFNVIGTNNSNNEPVEEWNGGSPKEDAQDNRKGVEPKQDTNDGEQGEEEEEEWSTLVEEIQAGDPDSLYCQDLQVWQDGVTSRKHADQCLHEAFQTCEKALEDNVDFMLQGVAVPIHEHSHNTLTKRFNDIANSISSNHSRRQDLLKRLHDRNSEWGKTYRTLKARVQNDSLSNEEGQQGDEKIRPGQLETIVEESDGDKKEEASNKTDEEEEGGTVEEPDWDTIVQEHEPSRGNIRRLLEARDEMEAAEERLATALEDINAGLKECTATILQAAVELHQDATGRLDGRQVDIQESLASNFRRNQQLEKAIEESAKQALGVFSSLMARLKATAKSALSGPAAAGGAAAAPRRK